MAIRMKSGINGVTGGRGTALLWPSATSNGPQSFVSKATGDYPKRESRPQGAA